MWKRSKATGIPRYAALTKPERQGTEAATITHSQTERTLLEKALQEVQTRIYLEKYLCAAVSRLFLERLETCEARYLSKLNIASNGNTGFTSRYGINPG